ncbi:MAG TPA: 50S ribosomal protein L13 [Spirochaetota bacterium]|jgi:large subunit ribosomal protein L13|nr:50S ribosomal protein L13 [Spirochaetota bacterium]HOF12780.1 50S ribosomal protein L13 [Spirochaetota bacterium]HOM86573.1 50S ribosomal protein L13 [Spirochaetota bacterium]HOR92825.1 50S ribosomal protein L13 [Spirochaetota bacterium]HOT18594.1 50S ribosomal protein L13 [Spirochaetota bacterium]
MSIWQRTFSLKKSQIEKKWYIIDAEGKVLGRLAAEIAHVLRGKHKPTYSAHLDMGDNIVVINAEKILLTGKKPDDKEYFFHSGYPGGMKFVNIKKMLQKKPEYVLYHAVKGMMPKNKLSRNIMGNLKIYAGKDHPHQAQKPENLELKF